MSAKLEGHTLHSFDADLNNIHMMIVEMAGLVLDQTREALFSFNEQDFEIVNLVIEREHQVDAYEKKIDEEIVVVTARRSPVAKDLRTILSLSKSVTDFERIGDEAAKIAHITKEIFDNERADPSVHLMRDVTTMGDIALDMLQTAVSALDTIELEKAEALVENHFELDIEFQSSLRRLTTFILEDSRNVGHTISIVLILKALERIGEHARNIAENIVFLVKGTDVRHITSKSERINH
jgi:phosphate transport system protein